MNKAVLASQITDVLEAWAPPRLAYDWDNVGLQIGTLDKPVSRVLVTLDVLENVADEAIVKKADLIIAHHPMLFRPFNKLDTNTTAGRVIQKLIKHNIAVYAAHTNLDAAENGVSDMLARRLGLENRKVMIPAEPEKLLKLVVFVPEEYADKVREAMGEAGAGHIGNYSHCFFKTSGEGSFQPEEGTDPFIGSQNELEQVKEVRLETIVTQSGIRPALTAMLAAHPYEEVAYDLIPLANKTNKTGLGITGHLPSAVSLAELCEQVKTRLEIPALRVTGDLGAKVQKIAVLGGSGKTFATEAFQQGADVYITGDMSFHEAQDAMQMGLHVIDPGHYAEKVMIGEVAEFLKRKAAAESWKLEIIPSEENTEPFQFL